MSDNGGTGGVRVFNAGMRGSKGTPYQGGTRVPAFVRWTGTFQPGDRDQLTAHIDIFPTFAELAAAKIPDGLKLDGRSLVPLLKDAQAPWPDRIVFTHVGRWPKGQAAASKYANAACAPRATPWSITDRRRSGSYYDIKVDPGEKRTISSHDIPDVVQRKLDAAYDQWWNEVCRCCENEDAKPPEMAPYKLLYWKQYGGGPGRLPEQ